MDEDRRDSAREDRQGDEEVSVTTAVGTFKARGSDILTTIFGVAGLCGMTLIIYGGYTHMAEAHNEAQAIVSAIKESSQQQREMVNAQRETNCLARLDPKSRKEADVEFCRQLGRGR